MKHYLMRWFSALAAPARPGHGRRPPSFRPALESLEERRLLSAYPAVGTLVGNEDFVLYANGDLKTIHGLSKDRIDGNVVSLTVGTDQSGSGMVAYVKTDGTAHVWSDMDGTVKLGGIGSNVKAVAAGQKGVVYVLLTSGHLFEFEGAANNFSAPRNDLGGNVQSVSAGTDFQGNTMADIVTGDHTAWEWSYDHTWNPNHGFYWQLTNPLVTNNIKSVGAGQHGSTDVVLNDGTLWRFNESTGQWTELDTGVL